MESSAQKIEPRNAAFWDEADTPGFLKAAFLGFPKSGKTTTATLLACGMREYFSLKNPITFFDTENGAAYVVPLIVKLTGQKPLVKRARSFEMLMQWAQFVEREEMIGISDSITHPWAELMQTWLDRKNEKLERFGKKPVSRLDFSDIGKVKAHWNDNWTRWFVNSPTDLLTCGRAGWEWDKEENDEGKKELVKTGVKMRTEAEFGFEPSLLVEMERVQDLSGEHTRMARTATILGDRFGSSNGMDGKVFTFPSLGDAKKEMEAVVRAFEPHLAMLKRGSNPTVNIDAKTSVDVDENGDADWQREKRTRTILCEEIQAELVRAYPGQNAADKKAKADLIRDAFDTGSWTKVENMDSETLRRGLAHIRGVIGTTAGPAGIPDSERPTQAAPTADEPF